MRLTADELAEIRPEIGPGCLEVIRQAAKIDPDKNNVLVVVCFGIGPGYEDSYAVSNMPPDLQKQMLEKVIKKIGETGEE